MSLRERTVRDRPDPNRRRVEPSAKSHQVVGKKQEKTGHNALSDCPKILAMLRLHNHSHIPNGLNCLMVFCLRPVAYCGFQRRSVRASSAFIRSSYPSGGTRWRSRTRYPSQSGVCEPVASGDVIVGVTESRYRRAEVLKPLLVGYVPDDQEVVGKGSRILSADGLLPKGGRLVVGEKTTVYL